MLAGPGKSQQVASLLRLEGPRRLARSLVTGSFGRSHGDPFRGRERHGEPEIGRCGPGEESSSLSRANLTRPMQRAWCRAPRGQAVGLIAEATAAAADPLTARVTVASRWMAAECPEHRSGSPARRVWAPRTGSLTRGSGWLKGSGPKISSQDPVWEQRRGVSYDVASSDAPSDHFAGYVEAADGVRILA